MLTSSSGTNYVLDEHEHLGQHGSYAIPSVLQIYFYRQIDNHTHHVEQLKLAIEQVQVKFKNSKKYNKSWVVTLTPGTLFGMMAPSSQLAIKELLMSES